MGGEGGFDREGTHEGGTGTGERGPWVTGKGNPEKGTQGTEATKFGCVCIEYLIRWPVLGGLGGLGQGVAGRGTTVEERIGRGKESGGAGLDGV